MMYTAQIKLRMIIMHLDSENPLAISIRFMMEFHLPPNYILCDIAENILTTLPFILLYNIHPGRAPKTVKLFINQPQTLDFDTAEQSKPLQEFT